MAIRDYDRIIMLIEENITKKKADIVGMVTAMLHLSSRDVNEILKFIDPKGRTLPSYIFERKIFRALEDFADGMSKDDIAEKYHYADTTHFGQNVYNLCGEKTPLQHRKDGYVCPAPLYLKDILEGAVSDIGSVIEEAYKKELIGYIDEITRLRDELSKEKKKGSLKMVENVSATKKDDQSISADRYIEFMKIEDMRTLYGFDVKTILRLYNQSVTSGISLEDLCDQELEKMYYTDNSPSSRDEIASLAYHVLYEGDSMQNWAYFAGDDEVDDMESMREENLYHDTEELYDFDDICGENREDDDFEEDFEDDYEPTAEELKEWLGTDPPESGGDTFA